MKYYQVLLQLSTSDGTHIMPGAIIGLSDEARAGALITAGALIPAAPAAPATPAPAPDSYLTIVAPDFEDPDFEDPDSEVIVPDA